MGSTFEIRTVRKGESRVGALREGGIAGGSQLFFIPSTVSEVRTANGAAVHGLIYMYVSLDRSISKDEKFLE